MKKLLPQSNIFNLIIGKQKYDNKAEYRFIKYIIKQIFDDETLIYNSLTAELISFSDNEFVNDKELKKYLIENYFLVPIDFDDYKFYEQCYSLMLSFDNSDAINNYVIMPTMDCNARCFYCFEHGSNRYHMSEKTAYDAADFIIEKSKGKKIKIQWFGGEPLFNHKIIDIISDKLKENNLNYKSIMISNGYLFDDLIINKAKSNWNLESVQITLDGTEVIYNKIKAYIYKDNISPFIKVLNNIEKLLKADINVIVRVNMDKHNIDDLYQLVDLLYQRFKDYKNRLTIYAWLLYDNRGAVKNIRTDLERHELTKHLLELEDYIDKKGFATKSMPPKEMKLYSCWADEKSSAIILPNGNLGRCDHHSDDEIYGNIYSNNIDYDIINSWKIKRDPIELCKSCPLVPQCLHLKKCPDDGAYDCDIYEQKKRMHKLLIQIRNAFENFKL